ncbi:MAG: ring-cleaving dioxygenase [Solirubrobacterales bacterium]|nr:ring-cleaving dioxygenase [Solirubrobacterales bacterium]
MKLEGIHHITAITGDAPGNVDFYVGTLGLRMVKKTVNQDDPTVYHLFYADEHGSPGSDLTFFEYPGAAPGRAGAGMVHRIVWRVGALEAIDFWADRLDARGVAAERVDGGLRFADPEGLGHELVVATVADAPLVGGAPDVPRELALQGFDGVRAYGQDPARSESLLRDVLGFAGGEGGAWEVRGDERGGRYLYDAPPEGRPAPGAGTVHHVAFATRMDDHEAWRERVAASGAHPTPVIDRFYFRSVYFREPSGVLFELATMGPGFGADEDPEHLGERLSLPPRFESRRADLERRLTPLRNPRAAERAGA